MAKKQANKQTSNNLNKVQKNDIIVYTDSVRNIRQNIKVTKTTPKYIYCGFNKYKKINGELALKDHWTNSKIILI